MHTVPSRRSSTCRALARGAAVATLIVGAVSCGSDDGDEESAAPAAEGEESTASESGGAEGGSGDCAGTDLTFTNLSTGESVDITSTAATSSFDGGLYTLYAADYELEEGQLRSFYPEVPADGNVVIVQLTMFNAADDPEPLEAGTEIDWNDASSDALTFLVSHRTSDESYETASADTTSGSLSVTAVGDVVCAEVAYGDADKELAGTIEAAVLISE